MILCIREDIWNSIEQLENYKKAIKDYEEGNISLEECIGWIHYHANHNGMTYEKYISLG